MFDSSLQNQPDLLWAQYGTVENESLALASGAFAFLLSRYAALKT
jgi:hypothetical protein